VSYGNERKDINGRIREKRGFYESIAIIGRGATKRGRGVICVTLPFVPTYGALGFSGAHWWCWTVVFASQGLATWAITSEKFNGSGKSKDNFGNSG
jgi:hypothetical protein